MKMPESKKPDQQEKDQFCFQLGQVGVDKTDDQKAKRTFSGVAYSGEAIIDHWYWDRVVFDLDTIQIKGRIPALLEHSTRQRAGAINTHSVSHTEGLKIKGTLLSNEFGTQVAQDSDDGFPWQMSVRIYPNTVEEVKEGSVIVNGRTFQAPIAIFRGGRIREVSFCALGADDDTNAVAASHDPKSKTFNQEDTDVTELEKEQAARKKAEQERDADRAELNKFKADKRAEDIRALETKLNTQFSAEDKKTYTDMDETSFAFMSKQLGQFSNNPEAPPAGQQQQTNAVPPHLSHLFSHQATGGQGGQQGQGGNSNEQHRFTSGAQAFASQSKGA